MSNERDVWIQEVDTALRDWCQGDCVLGENWGSPLNSVINLTYQYLFIEDRNSDKPSLMEGLPEFLYVHEM